VEVVEEHEGDEVVLVQEEDVVLRVVVVVEGHVEGK
jgi:hypothetical protein